MFRNVPACSGMFHVPDFIDGPTYHHCIGFWRFCMRFSVLAEFFCGFAVLDDFFFGFAVSNIPQCPPPFILLLRHFETLNFSSFKQRKGNNIYKLTRIVMWLRTDVRTFIGVCLQQRSSTGTWNYMWNLTLRRWIFKPVGRIPLRL